MNRQIRRNSTRNDKKMSRIEIIREDLFSFFLNDIAENTIETSVNTAT
jgi:hypothetical protein